MRIAIASDHAAIELKALLREWMLEEGFEVADLGPETAESVDYPDCGSGIGISIAVNRNPLVRCALVSEPLSAQLAREHNDANVIAMGARTIGPDMAKACLAAFLEAEFAGGRHQRRVDKLSTPPHSIDRILPHQ